MARGIKLTDSVSISELMHMREVEGLSNGEIARRLGVHLNTICKAIGPHPDGKRAKRKEKKLPALPEKRIPDMPRESFKERCDRLMAGVDSTMHAVEKTRQEIAAMAPGNPVGEMPTEADKAREAHEAAMRNILPDPIPCRLEDVAREAFHRNAQKQNPIIPELLAVFGPETVRAYLKVSLYAMGIPYCREVKREHLLTALKTLNGEAIKID